MSMTSHGVRRRVLVVEDEPIINQAVVDRLVSEGFEVHQVYDGPTAVATAAAWTPDLVVLDVVAVAVRKAPRARLRQTECSCGSSSVCSVA